MALFGTKWHCLRGPLFHKANSGKGLGKSEKGAGTLVEESPKAEDEYECEHEYYYYISVLKYFN
jgi:hypothetical protein